MANKEAIFVRALYPLPKVRKHRDPGERLLVSIPRSPFLPADIGPAALSIASLLVVTPTVRLGVTDSDSEW